MQCVACRAPSLVLIQVQVTICETVRHGVPEKKATAQDLPGAARMVALGCKTFPTWAMAPICNQPQQAGGASNGRFASQGIHNQRTTAGNGSVDARCMTATVPVCVRGIGASR